MIINYKGKELEFDEEFLMIYQALTFEELDKDIEYAVECAYEGKNVDIEKQSAEDIVKTIKDYVIFQIEEADCDVETFKRKRGIGNTLTINIEGHEIVLDKQIAVKYAELELMPFGTELFEKEMISLFHGCFNGKAEDIFKNYTIEEIQEKMTNIMEREIKELS